MGSHRRYSWRFCQLKNAANSSLLRSEGKSQRSRRPCTDPKLASLEFSRRWFSSRLGNPHTRSKRPSTLWCIWWSLCSWYSVWMYRRDVATNIAQLPGKKNCFVSYQPNFFHDSPCNDQLMIRYDQWINWCPLETQKKITQKVKKNSSQLARPMACFTPKPRQLEKSTPLGKPESHPHL